MPKQDNVAASDKFCISAKRTIYKNGVLSSSIVVFHFQMPLEKSIIFLNHRNGFCECDVLEFVLVF
jgi:hypothetical protein